MVPPKKDSDDESDVDISSSNSYVEFASAVSLVVKEHTLSRRPATKLIKYDLDSDEESSEDMFDSLIGKKSDTTPPSPKILEPKKPVPKRKKRIPNIVSASESDDMFVAKKPAQVSSDSESDMELPYKVATKKTQRTQKHKKNTKKNSKPKKKKKSNSSNHDFDIDDEKVLHSSDSESDPKPPPKASRAARTVNRRKYVFDNSDDSDKLSI